MDAEENKILGELLFDLAHGNQCALEGIAKRIEPLLLAIGNRSYYNHADVEDAVHQLYHKLLTEDAKKFKENTNACAWIVTVYKNLIRMDFRKREREDAFINEYGEIQLSNNQVYDEAYIERYLFWKELQETLTEEEIDLIEYRYWCNATIREIAMLLHKPKSTIEYKCKKLEEKLSKLN